MSQDCRHKRYRDKIDDIKMKQRQYYQDNRDRIIARIIQYEKEHPEGRRNRHKKYRDSHPEKIQAGKEKWVSDNPNYWSEYGRQWRKDNPEMAIEYNHARRARKLASGGSYTPAEIQALFEQQEGKCFHCDADISSYFERDHWIPLSKGGSNYIENIRLLCYKCNRNKHDKLPCEWDNRYCCDGSKL